MRCGLDSALVPLATSPAQRHCLLFGKYTEFEVLRSVCCKSSCTRIGMDKWPDMGASVEAVEALEHWLKRLRKAWKAGGWLYYPWHPDD